MELLIEQELVSNRECFIDRRTQVPLLYLFDNDICQGIIYVCFPSYVNSVKTGKDHRYLVYNIVKVFSTLPCRHQYSISMLERKNLNLTLTKPVGAALCFLFVLNNYAVGWLCPSLRSLCRSPLDCTYCQSFRDHSLGFKGQPGPEVHFLPCKSVFWICTPFS